MRLGGLSELEQSSVANAFFAMATFSRIGLADLVHTKGLEWDCGFPGIA